MRLNMRGVTVTVSDAMSTALSDERMEELEAEFSLARERLDSKREEYPLLERVILGQESFAEATAPYEKTYLTGCYLDTWDLKRYGNMEAVVQSLSAHVGMLEDLSGIGLRYDLELVEGALTLKIQSGEWAAVGKTNSPVSWSDQLRLRQAEDVFLRIGGAAEELDGIIRRYYVVERFRSSPALFEETYVKKKVCEQIEMELERLAGVITRGKAQGYGLVSEVLDGTGSLSQRVREFKDTFKRVGLSGLKWVVSSDRMLEKICGDYLAEIAPFIGMLEDLTGKDLLFNELFRKEVRSSVFSHRRSSLQLVDAMFDLYIAVSDDLDRRIRMLNAPLLAAEAPEVFRDAYTRMHPFEQEYVGEQLFRALEAGGLPMSELELLDILKH